MKCPFCGIKITAHSAEQARMCLTDLAKTPGVKEARDAVTSWLIEEEKTKSGVFERTRR